jgi:hypothetical protein
MAEEIQILREFRDEYLLANPLGQALTNIYYCASPPVAEFITDHPGLKPVVRAGLAPALAASAMIIGTTPAERTVMICSLVLVSVLVSVLVAAWARKQTGSRRSAA